MVEAVVERNCPTSDDSGLSSVQLPEHVKELYEKSFEECQKTKLHRLLLDLFSKSPDDLGKTSATTETTFSSERGSRSCCSGDEQAGID